MSKTHNELSRVTHDFEKQFLSLETSETNVFSKFKKDQKKFLLLSLTFENVAE